MARIIEKMVFRVNTSKGTVCVEADSVEDLRVWCAQYAAIWKARIISASHICHDGSTHRVAITTSKEYKDAYRKITAGSQHRAHAEEPYMDGDTTHVEHLEIGAGAMQAIRDMLASRGFNAELIERARKALNEDFETVWERESGFFLTTTKVFNDGTEAWLCLGWAERASNSYGPEAQMLAWFAGGEDPMLFSITRDIKALEELDTTLTFDFSDPELWELAGVEKDGSCMQRLKEASPTQHEHYMRGDTYKIVIKER